MTPKTKDDTQYVATTGLNYPSAQTGKEVRVEAGELVLDMAPTSLKHELEAGNVKVAGSEEDEQNEGSE